MLLVITSSPPGMILLTGTPKFEASTSRLKLLSIPANVEYVEWAEHEYPCVAPAHRLLGVTRDGQKVVFDDQMRLFVASGLRKVGLEALDYMPSEVRAT